MLGRWLPLRSALAGLSRHPSISNRRMVPLLTWMTCAQRPWLRWRQTRLCEKRQASRRSRKSWVAHRTSNHFETFWEPRQCEAQRWQARCVPSAREAGGHSSGFTLIRWMASKIHFVVHAGQTQHRIRGARLGARWGLCITDAQLALRHDISEKRRSRKTFCVEQQARFTLKTRCSSMEFPCCYRGPRHPHQW